MATFVQQFDNCYKKLSHLPRKYQELIMMAIGCARNAQTTINVHARLALENGATLEELGETLKIGLFPVRLNRPYSGRRSLRSDGDGMIFIEAPWTQSGNINRKRGMLP
jgi:AhpD family alkylhydroperoxidase